MGKISMIVVIGFAVIVGVVGTAMNKRTADAQKKIVSIFENAQAKNVAKSATDIYARALKKDSTLNGTFALNIIGGSATVGISEDTAGNRRHLGISTVGQYGSAQKNISLDAEKTEAPIPTFTGAMNISSNTASQVKATGTGLWTGIDYSAPGASWNGITAGNPPAPTVNASGKNVDGISMGKSSDVTYQSGNALFGGVPVTGKRATPANKDSAALGSAQPDYYNLAMSLVNHPSTVTITSGSSSQMHFGTTAAPKITCLKGNLTFSNSEGGDGCGVLIIDGNVSFNGNPTFQGLVIVLDRLGTGAGSTFTQTSGNDMNVCGGIVLAGKKANFVANNSVSKLWYSSQAIKNYALTPFLGAGTGGGAGSGGGFYAMKNRRE